jgi:hypothetical protein
LKLDLELSYNTNHLKCEAKAQVAVVVLVACADGARQALIDKFSTFSISKDCD